MVHAVSCHRGCTQNPRPWHPKSVRGGGGSWCQLCSLHTGCILWSGILVAKTKPVSLCPSGPFSQDASPARKLEPVFDFLYPGRGQRLIRLCVCTSMMHRWQLSNGRATVFPKSSRATFAISGVMMTLRISSLLAESAGRDRVLNYRQCICHHHEVCRRILLSSETRQWL